MNAELKYQTLVMLITEDPSHITAVETMRMYQKIMHKTISWQEFSSLLDELHTLGVLKIKGHTSDGMTIYSL